MMKAQKVEPEDQGVILPAGVRAFPAGNLETLQEILPENDAFLSHFEFCG